MTEYLRKHGSTFYRAVGATTDYSSKREIIDTIQIAMEDQRVVFITYQSLTSTEPVTYDVHPYQFTEFRNALYLHGFKPDDDEFRTWKIDRIEAAECDKMPFVRKEEFNISEYLSGSLGIFREEGQVTVKIHFAANVARQVQERQWHSSQVAEPHPDGSVTLTFELSGTTELKSWVLAFGKNALVLEPDCLKNEIIADLEALQATYQAVPTENEKGIRRGARNQTSSPLETEE